MVVIKQDWSHKEFDPNQIESLSYDKPNNNIAVCFRSGKEMFFDMSPADFWAEVKKQTWSEAVSKEILDET